MHCKMNICTNFLTDKLQTNESLHIVLSKLSWNIKEIMNSLFKMTQSDESEKDPAHHSSTTAVKLACLLSRFVTP